MAEVAGWVWLELLVDGIAIVGDGGVHKDIKPLLDLLHSQFAVLKQQQVNMESAPACIAPSPSLEYSMGQPLPVL